LVRLLGGSPQTLVRRLQLLFHNQYLDRPREQIEFYTYAGSRPIIYGLGNRGADVLAERFGLPRGKVNWTAKNKAVGPIFLEHTLLTADFMVALELACRHHGRVRLIEAEDILAQAPEATRRRKNPLGWNVAVTHAGESHTLGVIPDKVFGLHFLDKPEGKNRAYFFLEADRATMPIVRSNLRQTSFFRKLLGYYETWRQGLHTQLYGIKNFRVLTVTSSLERVQNLVAANRQVDGKGLALFLFIDEASLRGSEQTLALPWISGKDGQVVQLAGE
jgi:hypothetical protein